MWLVRIIIYWQYMLINRRDVIYAQTRLPISTVRMRRWKQHKHWTCTYFCRGRTPHCKQLLCLQLSVQWRHSCSARTSLPDYWQVWQRTDLASHFTRGSVASASAYSVGLLKYAALSRQSFRQCVSSSSYGLRHWGHSSLCTRPYSSDQSWAL